MKRSSRPLRVLCCSGSLDGGGSERQLWQLVCNLNRQQFQPSVYLLYNRGVYLEQLPKDVPVNYFWNAERERSLQCNRGLLPTSIRRRQIDDLTNVIRNLEIDLVYDRTFHMTLVTAAACRRANIPRVSVIVSPPSQDFRGSRERFKFFKRWILSRAYRNRKGATIAVSDEVARDAAQFYRIPLKEIVILPNPIDIALVQSMAKAESNEPNEPCSRAVRFAIVGRLSHEKGHRLIFNALRIAKAEATEDLILDVVGDGPDRQVLEEYAKELGILDSIRFHGFQSNPYPYMKQAALVCIASDYEGLPNVALESMAIGTALVATDCSESLRCLIGADERGVIVPKQDPQALANVFLGLKGSEVTWQERKRAAFDWVSTNHALAPWLEQMQSLFAHANAFFEHNETWTR